MPQIVLFCQIGIIVYVSVRKRYRLTEQRNIDDFVDIKIEKYNEKNDYKKRSKKIHKPRTRISTIKPRRRSSFSSKRQIPFDL